MPQSPDLGWLVGISLVVLLGLLVTWNPLRFDSLDPESAAARGVSTRAVSVIFIVLLGLIVAVSVHIIGALLVMALLVTHDRGQRHDGEDAKRRKGAGACGHDERGEGGADGDDSHERAEQAGRTSLIWNEPVHGARRSRRAAVTGPGVLRTDQLDAAQHASRIARHVATASVLVAMADAALRAPS